MKDISMYVAAGLFTAGERFHNAQVEKNLVECAKKRDINLITSFPQRNALSEFGTDGLVNIAKIVSNCEWDAALNEYILCNLDGTDADSGTADELGIARGQQIAYDRMKQQHPELELDLQIPKIITYRTDFRTVDEKDGGDGIDRSVNAMLRPEGSRHVYHPCFNIELSEANGFYKELASKIIDVVKSDIK